MAHLRGLKDLAFLSLNDLPITDSGLTATRDLPILDSVSLHGTRVEGRDLAAAKWLPPSPSSTSTTRRSPRTG